MKICFNLVVWCMLVPTLAWGQQANVNLDYNPQKNTENLIPFSAPLNSPEVRDDGTVTFRLKAPDAKNVQISGVALLTALGTSGQPVSFKKGEDEVWTLTVGPLRPDMYIYYFEVYDGSVNFMMDNLLADMAVMIGLPGDTCSIIVFCQTFGVRINIIKEKFYD